MPITRIIPTIRSGDVHAARAFYADLLGLHVDMAEEAFLMLGSPDEPAAQLVVNDNGFVNGDRSYELPAGVAIDVDDVQRIEDLFVEMQAREYAILEPLHTTPCGIRRFTVVGPGGTCVTILSHDPPRDSTS